MHSGELARLAGVTVRALRHYHQIGILAEPGRGRNGYRHYDMNDLIRVLRIRRLAGLGIPLERMPDLLDDAGDDPGQLLDRLDAELAGQIERLTRQRDLIASLRGHQVAPDVPPELAPFLAVLAAASPDRAGLDRDQSVLVAHLVGEAAMPQLTALYRRLSGPGLAPAVTAVTERFARLGPDSTEQEIADLVESFMATFASVVDEFAAAEPPIDVDAAGLLAGYAADLLNQQQRRTLEALEARLSQPRPS